MRVEKVVVKRILLSMIRSQIVSKQICTKHSEDFSWRKIDQMLQSKPLMNSLRVSTQSVQNMVQRASTYAAVITTWASYSKKKVLIQLPKQRHSFKRLFKSGKSLSSKKILIQWLTIRFKIQSLSTMMRQKSISTRFYTSLRWNSVLMMSSPPSVNSLMHLLP